MKKEQVEQRERRAGAEGFVAPAITQSVEQTNINHFHTRGGTGFAAEDANALADRMRGLSVDEVGRSFELNGPDRIVEGVKIQTKYYATADETVRSAFGADGMFRYSGQKLEVPPEQYDACVEEMRRKIADGRVPGHLNPEDATSILQKGGVTYRQARNIAKAGTIESLSYDAASGAVGAGFAFGLTFAISFARLKWEGASTGIALKASAMEGLGSGTLSVSTRVLTAQVLRTKAAAVGRVAARGVVREVAKTDAGRKVVEKIAEASLGKVVHGGAAVNHVAKLGRTTAVAGAITTIVMSTPDVYRAAIARSMSWRQVGKNLVVNGSTVAAGAGGWIAGAAGGAAVGSLVPVVGTLVGGVIGGVVGSVVAGSVGGKGAKAVMDRMVDDDSKQMLAIVGDRVAEQAASHLLSDEEFARLVEEIKSEIGGGLLKTLFKSRDRNAYADGVIAPLCERIAAARPRIAIPSDAEVLEVVGVLLVDARTGD